MRKPLIQFCEYGQKFRLKLPQGHPKENVELIHLRYRNCFNPATRRMIDLPHGTEIVPVENTDPLYGIDLKTLDLPLYKVAPELDDKPIESFDAPAKFKVHEAGIVRQRGDFEGAIKEYWNLDTQYWSEFSFDEICKSVFSSFIQTRWHDVFDYVTPYHVVDKIRLSAWHTGYQSSWNMMVDHYNGIRRFNFGEGFEVRLDYTTGCNPKGYSALAPRTPEQAVYLDSELAFLIFKDNVHVLTIGFDTTGHGLLVTQVQLKQSKGNRWLYKLPKHYLDYSLERLAEAFECPIFLVDGADQAEAIVKSYGAQDADGVATKFDPNTRERIASFYNRTLAAFERLTPATFNNRKFHQLKMLAS